LISIDESFSSLMTIKFVDKLRHFDL
jgi:hypothetical protein